jgi:hypothetical protein
MLGGLAAATLLSLVSYAPAAEPPPPLPTPVAAAPQIFDLPAAREAAVANQPAVVAARASLTASQLKAEALERMRLAALVAPDLPVRRKQAALGVTIAQGAVDAAECEARYAATYSYLAVLYAREQKVTADKIRQRLTDLKTATKTALDNGKRKDVSQQHIDEIEGFIAVVDGRRQEAVQGEERALAALREALGLAADCPIAVNGKEMPDVQKKADRESIVQMAQSRRGEIVQAATAVDVYCLEVDAQGALCLSPARTFASGGDIHNQALPATDHEPMYRPGAVAPEMPATLTGSRRERQDQAEAYHARAAAVADKTRNLIGLEAANGYLLWKQYDEEASRLLEAADKLEGYDSYLSMKFNPDMAGYPTVDDVLAAGLRSTQIRIDAVQAKFRRLTALAELERVTACGFDAGLDAPVPAAKPKP